MKIYKDRRQLKKESHLVLVFLLLTISIWSLSQKSTIKNNYQMYLSGAVLNLLRNLFAKYHQSIFGRVYSYKISCFQHILPETFKRMCLDYKNYSLRRILKQHSDYKSLIAKAFDRNIFCRNAWLGN